LFKLNNAITQSQALPISYLLPGLRIFSVMLFFLIFMLMGGKYGGRSPLSRSLRGLLFEEFHELPPWRFWFLVVGLLKDSTCSPLTSTEMHCFSAVFPLTFLTRVYSPSSSYILALYSIFVYTSYPPFRFFFPSSRLVAPSATLPRIASIPLPNRRAFSSPFPLCCSFLVCLQAFPPPFSRGDWFEPFLFPGFGSSPVLMLTFPLCEDCLALKSRTSVSTFSLTTFASRAASLWTVPRKISRTWLLFEDHACSLPCSLRGFYRRRSPCRAR